MEFLRFTLYAPLASWGETAIGEIRGSWDRPSRSAVLGLVAAALGIVREDDERHAQLDGSLRFAVRSLAPGLPLVDYHTTQNPKSSLVKKHRPQTRCVALSLGENETALSRRWLRQDALHVIALWTIASSELRLADLAAALQRPAFSLYAGRKANVLGLPAAPHIVQAESLADVLTVVPPLPSEFEALRPRGGWGRDVAHDQCEGFDAGLEGVSVQVRRDSASVRSRWQFRDRTVLYARIPSGLNV
jgi:CRISPR system Cascade subunit CasD